MLNYEDKATKLVAVYSSKICGYCLRAKHLLATSRLIFDEVEVGAVPDVFEVLMQKAGHRTLPQIFIGEVFIGGYTELAALHRSGQLPAMLG